MSPGAEEEESGRGRGTAQMGEQRPSEVCLSVGGLNDKLTSGVGKAGSRSASEIQKEEKQQDKIKGVGGPSSAWGMRLDTGA